MKLGSTKTKSAKFVAAGASLLCCGIIAHAAAPADTIATRQANFTQMGNGMKAIRDEIKAPTPASDAIKAGAAAIDQAAGKMGGYFPRGSGPESGVKTEALPAIWDKNEEFQADTAKLVAASAALRAAAGGGNIDEVKAQLITVGGTCKECHQNFRQAEN